MQRSLYWENAARTTVPLVVVLDIWWGINWIAGVGAKILDEGG